MIAVRKAEDRGHFDFGWLNTYHSFSFGDYHDPRFMGFRTLRVINEDRVQPGEGFPTHSHRDMEIVTYVLEGALKHKDSMGNGSIIRRGDVQRMSAGKGVSHSEFNASDKEIVHLLQIWMLPSEKGAVPGYEQKNFSEEEKTNKLKLVVSSDGRDGSLLIGQNICVFATVLEEHKNLTYRLPPGKFGWVQVTHGAVDLNGTRLEAGDGAAVSDESTLNMMAIQKSEFLLFDLA